MQDKIFKVKIFEVIQKSVKISIATYSSFAFG